MDHRQQKLLRFGTVEWRDDKAMANGIEWRKKPQDQQQIQHHTGKPQAPRPVVGIRLFSDDDLVDTLLLIGSKTDCDIVQIPVSLFAYLPVLNQLKRINEIPFEDVNHQ